MGGAKFFGYFVWKITILRKKIILFPILGGVRPPWIRPWYCVDHYMFSHCIVCRFLVYGFWLPIWYLETCLTYSGYHYNMTSDLMSYEGLGLGFMVFNATFNNILAISWRSVLLMEESGETHRPVASQGLTLSHNVASNTLAMKGVSNRHCNYTGSCKFYYHTITSTTSPFVIW